MNDKVKVPSINYFLTPVLAALHELGGSASRGELINKVFENIVENMGLPPAVLQVPTGQGNRMMVDYRVGFAITRLKWSGLIDNSERGVWSLTEKGRNTRKVDLEEVEKSVRQKKQIRKQANTEEDLQVEDSLDATDVWREDLLDTLRNIPPDAFERLCRRLLLESGFIEVKVTGRSNDGGIDGHGLIRLAGLISFPVLFQCKRYSGSVGASVIRDFRGAMMGRAEKGLILTTGRFTTEAQREATRDGATPIDLIDGELLIERIKELELGLRVVQRVVEDVEVDRDWFASI